MTIHSILGGLPAYGPSVMTRHRWSPVPWMAFGHDEWARLGGGPVGRYWTDVGLPPEGEMSAEPPETRCRHCGEVIFSGHLLWCPTLIGRPEYRPRPKP